MNIFISWSGARARAVATQLKKGLRRILQATDPWMSDEDLASGVKWGTDIAARLENSDVGIICVTPERMNAPWLNFEAGAIAKKFDDSRVIPYLIDMTPSDLTTPLNQFQARAATRRDTLRMFTDINSYLDQPRPQEDVDEMFDNFWPKLEAVIQEQVEAGSPEGGAPPERSEKEMIEELLLLARDNARAIEELREMRVTSVAGKRLNSPNLLTPHEYRKALLLDLGHDPIKLEEAATSILNEASGNIELSFLAKRGIKNDIQDLIISYIKSGHELRDVRRQIVERLRNGIQFHSRPPSEEEEALWDTIGKLFPPD